MLLNFKLKFGTHGILGLPVLSPVGSVIRQDAALIQLAKERERLLESVTLNPVQVSFLFR